ncbi:hypothetical protein [Streptomyces lichenis]|uniref:VOC domain-containing protein n=1 Tax=Streptomyces lichenis TaxID=2306967 RepID=A0ABT0I939_9ACTN|nr:hypothetical protein [Streptomyces lichenis]MCK8677840.1 hypothetical protein [Streptomyces lichenis]
MHPTDLDFYAHVATHGDILGAGISAPPAQWEAALGPGYLDDTSPGLMRRDHGLVELSFAEDDEGTWSCFGISVRAHRLFTGDASTAPEPLRSAYGPFATKLTFDQLSAALTARGLSIELEDGTGEDVHQYRVPQSGARIFVVADPDPHGYGESDPHEPARRARGDVWSISLAPSWWSAAESSGSPKD